jgi:hypothetical protein
METVAIVLSVGEDRVDEFEAGFREHEVPVWKDLQLRGLLARASLNRLDISSRAVDGATQYLVVVTFTSTMSMTSILALPSGTRWRTPIRSASRWPLAARRS